MTTVEKIARCRKEKEFTQAELADLMGVSRQAVSRWESDLAFPETEKLIKLSKLFGCSTDWLLNYNEENFNVHNEENFNAHNEENFNVHAEAEEEVQSDGEEPVKKRRNVNWSFSLNSFYFEYKSKTCLGKLPLVHVNIGLGRTATGIIALGLKARGIISVGLLSLGVLSLGLLSLGVFAFGLLVAGLTASGAIAVGAIALGGLAIGLFAMGGCAAGLFSVGGYAAGYYVAIGGGAVGRIAVGGVYANGSDVSVTVSDAETMKDAVYAALEEIPALWSVFISWMRGIFNGVLNGSVTLGG